MKRWIAGAIFIGLVMSLHANADESFPKKNITIIVAASPGGGFDRLARAIGRSMKKFLPNDVSVLVKNIPGGGNVIGTVAMYRAKPDGYTLGHLYTDGMLSLQMIRGAKKVGYDVGKFTYIGRVGAEPLSIITGKNSPFKTLKDLQKAKRVRWGVEGIGVSRWGPSLITAKELGIDFHVVSGYGGTGEALPAMIRNDFDVLLQPIDHPTTASYINSGDVRPLLHLHDARPENAPDTPTAKELGYDLTLYVGRSIVAPPGLPKERAKVLEDLLMKAMTDQDYQTFVAKSGAKLIPGDAAQANKDLEGFEQLYSKYSEDMRKALGQK